MISGRNFDSHGQVFDKTSIFRRHPLFRELGPKVHRQLASYAATRKFERGATIFMKGDSGTCLFAVCSGIVEVKVPSTEGKNVVVNLIVEGDIFGEIAFLDGLPRTADAAAFTDCTIMVIERRDFLPVLHQHPEVALRLLEVLCTRVRRTTEQVQELMFLDLEARLARALLRLRESVGPPYRICVSQGELSEIAGVSREETNKQLQIWTKSELIRLERRSITVLQLAAFTEIAAL
jgi:CRP-like cAMP-binding protein